MGSDLRIVMMGTGTFAEPTFIAMKDSPFGVAALFTQPDRDGVARRSGSTRQTGQGMKEIAQDAGIPVYQPHDVNSPDGWEMLRSVRPDLLVVAAYGQILSADVLAVPTMGAINVHGSLLPKYRGAAPVARAILAGETETGVTIIRISTGLDAGDMLAVRTTPIGTDETAGTLESRLAVLGAEAALEVVTKLLANPELAGAKQDRSMVTKAPKLRKEEGAIDWGRQPAEIDRHVRAMQPWPTAYTNLVRGDRPPIRVIIGSVREADGAVRDAKPGTVRCGPSGEFQVVTGSGGVVEILELQPAGKKRMSAQEFLRGHPITPDTRFEKDGPTG